MYFNKIFKIKAKFIYFSDPNQRKISGIFWQDLRTTGKLGIWRFYMDYFCSPTTRSCIISTNGCGAKPFSNCWDLKLRYILIINDVTINTNIWRISGICVWTSIALVSKTIITPKKLDIEIYKLWNEKDTECDCIHDLCNFWH